MVPLPFNKPAVQEHRDPLEVQVASENIPYMFKVSLVTQQVLYPTAGTQPSVAFEISHCILLLPLGLSQEPYAEAGAHHSLLCGLSHLYVPKLHPTPLCTFRPYRGGIMLACFLPL